MSCGQLCCVRLPGPILALTRQCCLILRATSRSGRRKLIPLFWQSPVDRVRAISTLRDYFGPFLEQEPDWKLTSAEIAYELWTGGLQEILDIRLTLSGVRWTELCSGDAAADVTGANVRRSIRIAARRACRSFRRE